MTANRGTRPTDSVRRAKGLIEKLMNRPKDQPPFQLLEEIAAVLDDVRTDERKQCASRIEAVLRAKLAINSQYARLKPEAQVAYREAMNACLAGWTLSSVERGEIPADEGLAPPPSEPFRPGLRTEMERQPPGPLPEENGDEL